MHRGHVHGRLLKMAIAFVALSLAGYVAICTWFFVNQRSLLYFPQATRSPASGTDFSIDREGVVLRGLAVNPGKPRAILYFGGNAERVEAMRDGVARWFPDSTTYLVAYRGYGASDGEPSEPALLADALVVYDIVHATHPGQPIDVIGRSLGSGVASYVASRRPVARLALVTPFDRLSDVGKAHYPWLPVDWLAKERYPSIEWLPHHRGGLLVLRAGRDEVIPAANTQRLIDAASSPPRVVVFAQADHNSISEDPLYGAELKRFLH